jgi:hypothetical protein
MNRKKANTEEDIPIIRSLAALFVQALMHPFAT